MSLVAICNPVCGDGTAESFYKENVNPLLLGHGKSVDRYLKTEYPDHGGEFLLDLLETTEGDIVVVICSGDGTLHDIINYISFAARKGRWPTDGTFPRIKFVLVPCGTANALFSSLFPKSDDIDRTTVEYRLQAIHSYSRSSQVVPLTLITATLWSNQGPRSSPKMAISSVVMSTSLHASILRDSEVLRQEMPGIERFKVAARQNSTKWYNSHVKVFPTSAAKAVQVYDPGQKKFVDHPQWKDGGLSVDLDGPFVYFLSTINVDRLEPTFRIAPLVRTIPPTGASCDLLVIRPLRDPSITLDTPEARQLFVPKLWTVVGDAYNDGKHIDLRYSEDGMITSSGDGPAVVEYIRCGGWEWIPIDTHAGLLCSDGALFHIEQGGRAVCSTSTLTSLDANVEFSVYAE